MFRSLFVLSLLASPAFAQDGFKPDELHRHFQNEAEGYSMHAGDTQFQLRSQPLMHWQNPERNQEQGTTYVWEKDGAPQALVSMFTYENRSVVKCRHEMISLSNGAFDCRLHDEEVWTPKKSGLKWLPITDVVPASSASRRMFQMRSLARQFKGSVTHRGKTSLALIPQPLLRYQPDNKEILDGAIFSFAVATDPEILLMIEARQSENGKSQFFYAPVRSNYHPVELEREGKIVFEQPMVIALQSTRAGQRPWSDEPFFVFTPTQPLPAPGTVK